MKVANRVSSDLPCEYFPKREDVADAAAWSAHLQRLWLLMQPVMVCLECSIQLDEGLDAANPQPMTVLAQCQLFERFADALDPVVQFVFATRRRFGLHTDDWEGFIVCVDVVRFQGRDLLARARALPKQTHAVSSFTAASWMRACAGG